MVIKVLKRLKIEVLVRANLQVDARRLGYHSLAEKICKWNIDSSKPFPKILARTGMKQFGTMASD